jgi:hypothetical protein
MAGQRGRRLAGHVVAGYLWEIIRRIVERNADYIAEVFRGASPSAPPVLMGRKAGVAVERV